MQHLWIRRIPVKKHHLCLNLCFQIQKGGKAPRAGIWRLLHPTSVLLSKSTMAGTQSLDSYSVGWSCLSRELGAHDPLCSLPALPILQFCDSSLLYFFPNKGPGYSTVILSRFSYYKLGVQSRMLCVSEPLHFCAITGAAAILCFAVFFPLVSLSSLFDFFFSLSTLQEYFFAALAFSSFFFFSEK